MPQVVTLSKQGWFWLEIDIWQASAIPFWQHIWFIREPCQTTDFFKHESTPAHTSWKGIICCFIYCITSSCELLSVFLEPLTVDPYSDTLRCHVFPSMRIDDKTLVVWSRRVDRSDPLRQSRPSPANTSKVLVWQCRINPVADWMGTLRICIWFEFASSLRVQGARSQMTIKTAPSLRDFSFTSPIPEGKAPTESTSGRHENA